jgi:hypothetical protein
MTSLTATTNPAAENDSTGLLAAARRALAPWRRGAAAAPS